MKLVMQIRNNAIRQAEDAEDLEEDTAERVFEASFLSNSFHMMKVFPWNDGKTDIYLGLVTVVSCPLLIQLFSDGPHTIV